jgi:ankyrin repeat protein
MKSKVVPLLILSALVACLPFNVSTQAQTSGRKRGAARAGAPARRPAADDPLDKFGSTGKTFTPLMKASARGDLKAVRELIRKGADVNEIHFTGLTALMLAVEREDLAVVKELLGAGADPDHKTMTPHAGQISALTWAITSRHDTPHKIEIIATLIEAGADVNPQAAGSITPLMFAVMPGGDARVVELLLSKGADVNGSNPDNGYTVLMGAAEEASPEIISVLVRAGADLHAKNKFGQTALSIAVKYGREDNERMLRLAGAKY